MRFFYLVLAGLIFCTFFLLYHNKNSPEAVVPQEVGVFDTYLGWKLAAEASATSMRTGELVEYHIDGEGRRFHDNSNSLASCTIAAIGDSNTFGFGVAIKDHWITQLRAIKPALRIFNLGVSGYGVDQSYLHLKEKAPLIKPQLVIAYVKHFDDFRHQKAYMFGQAKPYFTFDGESWGLHTNHIKLGGNQKLLELPESKVSGYNLGVAIIKKTKDWVEGQGGRFLLISGIKELCSDISENCFYWRQPPDTHIITPSGENLFHLNREANIQLAQDLIKYLETTDLLATECLL